MAYYICIEITRNIFTFSEPALRVLHTLEEAGYEAWFVGGCVRDALLGRAISDVDIATSARWEEAARACENAGMRAYETGTAHGTVTIAAGEEAFEVTTYRADSATSRDKRHPDSVQFLSSIEEDLARRDFTVNAMAWHPSRGLVDPFGAVSDVHAAVLRCVGKPAQRFQEDALRILRGCRFSSELGFTIDEKTFEAMVEAKHLLAFVSAERTTHELDRFIMGDHIHDALMNTVDVVSFALPELVAMKNCAQVTKYHIYDVLEHTAWAVQFAERDRLVRWAALCHDMGKPAAAFFAPDGIEHFYGHAAVSAQLASGIAGRLSMTSAFRNDLEAIIHEHSTKLEASPRWVKRMLNKLGTASRMRALLALKRADILAHAPAYHAQVDLICEVERMLDEVLASDQAFTRGQLAINGNDVISLGVNPGPQVGAVLEDVLREVVEDRLPNERAALLAFVHERI